MDPTLILAAGQAVLGGIQAISGGEKAKRLLAMRRAYKTPEEYTKILQETQNLASQGYDAFTLNYLTNQTDQVFSESVNAATRLGANANDLSVLFNQKVNSVMKIGAENHALNMENVGKYLNALDVMGQNKAAEWKSQQDLLKDQQQQAAQTKAEGVQNIFGGINTAVSGYANQQAMDLYKQKNGLVSPTASGIERGTNNAATGAAGGLDINTIISLLNNLNLAA